MMIRLNVWLFLVVATACSWGASAAGDAAVPDGAVFFPGQPSFGVNCHSYFNGKELKAIGANWVRLDLAWPEIEKAGRGQYDFSHYDKVVDAYRANGLNVLGILTNFYHCPYYPAPKADFAVAVRGFAAYAKATAAHFKGRIALFEIGNEPEAFSVDGVYNQPEKYTQLALAGARAIREVDPKVHIGALSVAWMDRPFISRCLELGLLQEKTIDVLTYHGYHRATLLPESGLRDDLAWFREQVRRHAPAHFPVILVDSERGYGMTEFLVPKHWTTWRNFVYTENEQAAYLARHYLEEIYLGVEVSIWYKDMNGETAFSLYEGGPGSRLRPMGHVMRNLAGVFDANPKEMINDRYTISLVDLPDDNTDPNASVKVNSYVRSYLKNGKAGGEKLIIALWNPVEAFDGRILQSRQRIGENFYEAWRAASPEDRVELPLQVLIAGVPAKRVAASHLYHLLAVDDKMLRTPLTLTEANGRLVTETLKVGPFPTLLVIELTTEK